MPSQNCPAAPARDPLPGCAPPGAVPAAPLPQPPCPRSFPVSGHRRVSRWHRAMLLAGLTWPHGAGGDLLLSTPGQDCLQLTSATACGLQVLLAGLTLNVWSQLPGESILRCCVVDAEGGEEEQVLPCCSIQGKKIQRGKKKKKTKKKKNPQRNFCL